MTITPVPDRLAQLPTITLGAGNHDSFDNGHCGMELAAWLAGEPHTDHPQCVCPVIARFVRAWNDALPDNKRTALLRDLIPLTIGTRGSDDLQDRRALATADWAVRVYTPRWLRLAGLDAEADLLAGLDPITSVEEAQAATAGPIKQARQAAAAARAAARGATGAVGDAAWAAAWDAAWAAVRAAARDAAWAAGGAAWAATEAVGAATGAVGDAAWAAVGDAAWAAAWDAAWGAAWAAGGAAWAATEAVGDAAWAAVGDAAWAAAWDAAWGAQGVLAPTVDELQAEAARFLAELCEMPAPAAITD